ncbi:hypothetical protein KP509_09G024900 [Ceratopteris richardii]|uniref:Histone-lysine N-methyltransferase n=1 Tax=Ceratopteris richardii TaxID=49495 RepID=A0A8T2U362_CERRI|nr:hypothetical protein KP509_09G024900 [Ceratopteris richardii]
MALRGRPKSSEDDDGCSYTCGICHDFGELLCCEQCGQGFHLLCLKLDKMPEEDLWLCNNCKANKVQCFECKDFDDPTDGRMFKCAYRSCKKFYHDHCKSMWSIGSEFSVRKLCPLHVCNVCGSRRNSGLIKLHKCLECPVAYHQSCLPDRHGFLNDMPGYMICSKHGKESCLPRQFHEFHVPPAIHDFVRKLKSRPQPFVHIRRNVYLVKKPKKCPENEFMQCACAQAGNSRESCERDCICSMLQYSCSEGCGCGPSCKNVPFQKRLGLKLDLVKTEKCGWGIVAAEKIRAGDFIIEYVGEVIDDKTCEERLWGIKARDETNFYMCEINREMVIDATFKGNLSRFINHSCCPNAQLQKWQIDEETRIGVFAISDIEVGEAISYDYQFIPFGQDQTCFCGAMACRGKLGRKPSKQKVSASVALQIVRKEVFGSKSMKRSSLHGFRVGSQYKDCSCTGLVPPVAKESCLSTSCLGLRVRIWWPLDDMFYSGKIVHFDSKEGTHKVEYDDGDCEILHMDKERWELEEPILALQDKPS